MAVRIPQYEQQTNVGGLGVVPHARPVQVDDSIGRGMQQFAGTLMAVGNDIAAERRREEAEDAKAWTANATAKAAQDMTAAFAKLQENAGAGAPNFSKDFEDQFNEYEEQALANAPNETSRKFLAERMLALRTDLSGRALTFEIGERRALRLENQKQAIDTTAATLALDPSRFNVAVAEQRAMIDALELPPEQKRALRQHLEETVSTAVVLGEIERDPIMARAKLADRLGIDAAAAGGPEAGADLVWDRIIHRESGGQQFGKDGAPLTSAKGATGRAQVMPGTGPEAAKLAGLPWDPQRFKTDADYNTALGRAYYDAQLREFGSPTLAAAAYNAGPGAVREWIERFGDPRKGQISVAEFAAKIPYKETREYVAAVSPPSPSPAAAAAANPDGQKTGDPAYDLLTVPQVVQLLARTNQEADKQQAVLRATVAAREADDLAAFGDGKAVEQPLTAAEFVAAYGGVEGARRWQNYQRGQTYAGDLANLSTMPPADIQRLVTERAPQPGPGYAAEAQRYSGFVQAARATLAARDADPITFAAGAGLATVEPLNLSNPDALGAELKNRAGVAATMSGKYGTRYTLLTKDEAGELATTMQAMTAPEKTQLLGTIREALPDDGAYHAIMAELRPDSPVTATAGSMLAIRSNITGVGRVAAGEGFKTPQQVAATLLIGEDLLNPGKDAKGQDGKPKMPMPEDSLLRQTWANTVGTAYAGSPETEAATYQAFRAYYAAEASRRGLYDGVFNEDIAEEAAQAVSGGVLDLGVSTIVLPYGIPADATRDILDRKWAEARTAAGLPDRLDLGDLDVRTIGDGLYSVSAGTGPVRDKAGRPILLRINKGFVLAGLPDVAPVQATTPIGGGQ